MDVLLEHALRMNDCPELLLPLADECVTAFEYADDVVLLSDDATTLQRLFARLTESGMRFAPAKCKKKFVQN